MSANIAIQQMERFISTPTPEVMAITGRWGVGKTFAWQKTIDAQKGRNSVGLQRYSYVSAFGIQSIEELKSSILQAAHSLKDTDFERKWDEFADGLSDEGGVLRNAQKATDKAKTTSINLLSYTKNFISAVPIINRLSVFGEMLSFQAIRNQIICIDDVERSPKSLGVENILGLASQLKEQKKCKVLLLLNEEGLEDEDTYRKYLEKVADHSIMFSPTPEEASGLALGNELIDSLLKEKIIQLGVTNIRVIKRIRSLLTLLEPELNNIHIDVVRDVVTSAAITGWGLFEPTLGPDLEELKKFNGLSESLEKILAKDYKTPERTRTKEMADKYGFAAFDRLDSIILDGLKSGWFQNADFTTLVTKLDADARVSGLRQAIDAPWAMISGSFRDNIDDVVKSLTEITPEHVMYMSPVQITDRARVLDDLGYLDDSQELVSTYLEVIGTFSSKEVQSLARSDAEPARAHPLILYR